MLLYNVTEWTFSKSNSLLVLCVVVTHFFKFDKVSIFIARIPTLLYQIKPCGEIEAACLCL